MMTIKYHLRALKKITLIFTAFLIVTCAIETLLSQSYSKLQRRGLSFKKQELETAGVNTNNPTELANFARQWSS